MEMSMLLFLLTHLKLTLCKKILFVDSSTSSALGNGTSPTNPLKDLESAFLQASDDLEIEIISSTNPYIINSSYAFSKSLKLFSSISPRPQLLVTPSAFLEFYSNASIKGLMIISNQEYKRSENNKALLDFGGKEGNLERELLMLEIANIEFNQGGLISGATIGSLKLVDIKITKIKARAFINGAFLNISYCDKILLENITVSGIDFSNFTLFIVGCTCRADSLSIIQSSFSSSNGASLFGIKQGSAYLTNCIMAKNYFNNAKIFETLKSSCYISIESTSIFDNTDNSKAGSLILLSREPKSKLYFSNSSINNNYAAGTFIEIVSEDSLIIIANVTISRNSYATCFKFKGPKLTLSASYLYFSENNANNSFFSSQNFVFGQALFIQDYIAVSMSNLGFFNNRAENTLQGLGLVIGEAYRREVSENHIEPEVTIGDFICKGNQGYHLVPPHYLGNCINLQFLGTIRIFKGLFDSNELDLSSKDLSVGASNPCIHSLGAKSELIVIDTVFNNNRGFDGCHCFAFEGERILLLNVNFTDLRSTRNNDSMFNMAGALSLGAKIIEMNGVIIANCSARKAAGILFQNNDGKEETKVLIDSLVIRLNVAKQSAGLEFDGALPMGTFIFNNSLLESNTVEFYGVVALLFKTAINITFTHCQFTNNSGASAGSLFTLLNIQGDLFLVDSKFYNNKLLGSKIFVGGSVAIVYGGALYTFIHFHNCFFKKNFCSGAGGVVVVRYGNLNINNSVFENNSAAFGGSLASGLSSQMTIYNTSFVGGFQDVEVKEAAAIFINDESVTRIINCTFFKLKAIASAAIQLYGINSRLEIYSCLFLWNSAMQGAIIFVFNRFMGWPIYIYNCLVQGNSVEKELIYLRNIRIIVVNFTVNQNIGKTNTLIHVELKFQFFSILNHVCQSKIDYGCFASISMGSNAEFYKTSFHNVSSGFERDFFQIKGSSVIINDLIYSDVNTKSEFGVSYAQNSNLTLASLNIKHLTSNLVFLEKSAFEINASCFYNITQHENFKYGAIQGHSSSRFLVSYCNFSLISTSSLGGIFYLRKGEGKGESFVMRNNVFSDSSALAGGVVYAEEQSLNFVNNIASNMSVAEDGGVTFLSTTRKSLIQWKITGNNFSLNTARKGGCIHSLGKVPQGIFNNSYTNNTARYGPDYSSFAVRLSLETNINNELITLNCSDICFIKNVGSGLPFESIMVSIFDTYGQKMVLEETIGLIELAYISDYSPSNVFGKGNIPEMVSSSSDSTILKGQKSVKSLHGIFNFSELLLVATPRSKVVLRVETDAIEGYMPEFVSRSSACDQSVLIGNHYHFLFVVEMRDCARGEIHLINENVCYPCPEGKYSLDTKDKQCHMCPDNAFCEGKDRIIVNHGYWRSSINSTRIWQCNVVSDPCLGGYESRCKEGYTSVVCGSCEFQADANQYFKNGLFFCYSCKELYKYVLVLLAGVFALIFALVFLVWYKQKRIRNIKEGALMKLLISHIHVTAFISNIRITLPDILQTFSSVQSPTTSTETFVFTMDCAKNKFQIPLFAVKLLLSVVIIFCIFFTIGLAFFIIMKRKKVPVEESLVNMLNALVIIAMFLQPLFINFYLQMLSCISYEDSYMVNYLDEKCWEGNHLIFSLVITIPMLIFWSVIYPGAFLSYLYRKRRTLDNPKVTRITIFFRAGFREKYYYWEFVIMSRKLIVVIITSLFGSEVEFVIYLIIPIIGFYCALQIYVRPYVQKNFNLLEILSLNATFITYYSAIFYLKTSSGEARLFFVILIIGVNIVFIFLWVHQYFVKMKNIIVQRKSKKSIQLIELPPISDGSSKRLSAPGSDSNISRLKLKFYMRELE